MKFKNNMSPRPANSRGKPSGGVSCPAREQRNNSWQWIPAFAGMFLILTATPALSAPGVCVICPQGHDCSSGTPVISGSGGQVLVREGDGAAWKPLSAVIGGNPDQYSTTETLTGGTWIDGKPIYRRVFEGRTSTTPGVWHPIDTMDSFDKIISMDGITDFVTSSDGMAYIMKLNYSPNESILIGIKNRSQVVVYWSLHSFFANRPVIVIIEYTKP